jgi:hypothetical protein
MAQLILLIMSAILILLVVAYGRTKKTGFDMLDAYFLMIMLYFGVYSIIDAVINEATGKDAAVVVLTFVLIFIAMLVTLGLYLIVLPLKFKKLLRFNYLIEQWANVDRRTIIFLGALFFAFNGYLFIEFGMITYVGTELELLNISMPTWIGPLKSLMNVIGFSCYVAIVASIINGRTRFFSLYSFLMLALVFVLSLEGRRAFVELMLITLILWSSFRRENIYSIKYSKHGLVMLIAFILLSNIYQTYRVEILSIQARHNGSNVTSFSDAAVNIDATIDNYKKRLAMWNFNYMITDAQANDPLSIFWGDLGLQSLLNSIPRAFWESKEVVDIDEMIANLYGFVVEDYPSNDFASFLSDFGIIMIVLLPMTNILVLLIASNYLSSTPKNSVLALLIPVFCLLYLIKVENSYGVLFILFINIILITALWLIATVLRRFLKACPKYLHNAL